MAKTNEIYYASLEWRNSLVKKLLKDISDDKKEEALNVSLNAAATSNNIKLVKYLIKECGVDVNYYIKMNKSNSNDDKSALRMAALNGRIKLVKYLVKKCGAEIPDNYEKINGYTYHENVYKYLQKNKKKSKSHENCFTRSKSILF